MLINEKRQFEFCFWEKLTSNKIIDMSLSYLLFLSAYTKSSSCKLLVCVLWLLSIMSTSHNSQVWLCRDPINQIHSIGLIQSDILWTDLARELGWSFRMAYATMPPGPNFSFSVGNNVTMPIKLKIIFSWKRKVEKIKNIIYIN